MNKEENIEKSQSGRNSIVQICVILFFATAAIVGLFVCAILDLINKKDWTGASKTFNGLENVTIVFMLFLHIFLFLVFLIIQKKASALKNSENKKTSKVSNFISIFSIVMACMCFVDLILGIISLI